MKVKVKETFKFAKDCRENILFQKNSVVSLDGLDLQASQIEYILKNCKVEKVSGLAIEPKKEIKLEKAVVETEKTVENKVVEVEEKIAEIVEDKKPEHYKIENKDELIKYAADNFSLRVDRRSSLQTILNLIDEHLAAVNE